MSAHHQKKIQTVKNSTIQVWHCTIPAATRLSFVVEVLTIDLRFVLVHSYSIITFAIAASPAGFDSWTIRVQLFVR